MTKGTLTRRNAVVALAVASALVVGVAGAREAKRELGTGAERGQQGRQSQPKSGRDSNIPEIPSDSMSGDDRLACTVAMCMANPGGPDEIEECKAPIEEWHKRMAKKPKPKPCSFLNQ